MIPATSHRPALPRPTGLQWIERGDSSTGTWVAVVTPPRVVHWPSLLLPILLASLVALLTTVLSNRIALGIAIGSAFGLLSALRVVGRFANTVRLSVDKEWLRFSRGPIPQRGALREYSWNVVSFAADTLETTFRIGRRSAPLRLWGVVARMQDGREIPMPFGFVEGEHAAYVAERLAEVVADAQRVGRAYRG